MVRRHIEQRRPQLVDPVGGQPVRNVPSLFGALDQTGGSHGAQVV
jgi:hypothetical protein